MFYITINLPLLKGNTGIKWQLLKKKKKYKKFITALESNTYEDFFNLVINKYLSSFFYLELPLALLT